MKISITRALAELKLLADRITKETGRLIVVDLYQKRSSKLLNSQKTQAEFESEAKSSLQSIQDLIARRRKIKEAIIASNSTKKVTISGVEYTVASAIDRKNAIDFERGLLERIKRNVTDAKKAVETSRPQLEAQVNKMLETNLGTDGKKDAGLYETIAKPFIEQNEMLMFDPAKAEALYVKMEKEIEEFLSEVDFVLSESNSTVEIEV